MNRGFKKYFSFANKKTKTVFKRKGNYLRYYLYLIMNLLGSIILLKPVFNLSNVRLARIAKEKNDIEISQSFVSSSKPRNFWTSLLTDLLILLINLSVVLLIFLITFGVLGIISSILAMLELYEYISITTQILSLPVLIGMVVILVLLQLRFLPKNFLIDSCDDMTVSDALYRSNNTMKQKCKGTAFLLILVSYLPLIAISFIAGLVFGFMYYYPEYMTLLSIIFVGLILLEIPYCKLKCDIALIELYEDMIIDSVNVFKTVDNIKIKEFKKSNMQINSVKDHLIKLFEDTEDVEFDPSISEPDFKETISEEELKSLKKKKNKKEKPVEENKEQNNVQEEVKEEVQEEIKEESLTNEEVNEEKEVK